MQPEKNKEKTGAPDCIWQQPQTHIDPETKLDEEAENERMRRG